MNRASGKRFGPYWLIAVGTVMVALAGCEEGLNLSGGTTDEKPSETAEASNTIELFPASSDTRNDVEAPEVFRVIEAGLWDGRPSLGGIWVAHPDVTQPERVLIKNTSNNKTVTGALFRRDATLPGPALQVSSLAAQQLGMLAGAPTAIEVVALRRETIAPPAEEPAPAEDAETPEVDADAEVDVAAAATDAAPTADEPPAKRKWWQKKSSGDAVAGAAAAGAATGAAVVASGAEETAAVAADVADVATTEEQPAKRKWWQKKPDATAEAGAATAGAASEATETAAAAPEASEAQAVAPASLTDPEITPPTEKPAKRKWWQKKDPDAITETQLDPIEGAAAAIDAAEPTPPVATAAAASTATTSALSKPYVQAGTFSVEANANSAAQKIRRNGMKAEVRELQSEGSSIWRVLVGPANTRAERKAILSDVKDLGFSDAFTASN